MISIPTLIRQFISSYNESINTCNQLPVLQKSFDPLPTIRNLPNALKNSTWPVIFHFSLILTVFCFSIFIMPISIFLKLILILILLYINFAPIFAQFFNNGLPILSWVFLFFNSKFIPLNLKRPISVKVLPALETIFYGDNLSEILASNTNSFLDVIAWLPYGLIHFALPFVVAFLIFIFAPPKTLPQFCWSFGFMNLTGVVIQNMIFSCAPPWYKVLHGLENANYSMKGSPGGLGRIDKLVGFDMYTTGFTNSPLIFGAMPSLHSGCSTMDALWLIYLFPKATPLWLLYVVWLWFSTMYLTHHYFIDLVVGSCLAVGFFTCIKWRGKLPINDKFCRWDYNSLSFHNIWNEDPLKSIDYFNDINDDINIDNEVDLENQIPLSDFSSSDKSNQKNSDNSNSDNSNSNLNSNLNLDSDSERYDDDPIPIPDDIQINPNKATKISSKVYKESFETISTPPQVNSNVNTMPSIKSPSNQDFKF